MLQFPTWKVALIALVTLFGAMLAFPNLLSEQGREDLPPGIPSNGVNLGLDLQGGVYMLLDVDSGPAIQKQLTDLTRDVRSALTERPRTEWENLRVDGDTVRLKIKDSGEYDVAEQRLRRLSRPVDGTFGTNSLEITRGAAGEFTLEFSAVQKETIARQTLMQTVEKLRPRIDPDGLGEITIQPQGEERIILEAPGIDDPERLKELIEAPGQLTFNMVDDNQDNIQSALSSRPRIGWSLVETLEPAEPYLLVRSTPIITGDMVRSASQGFDERNAAQVNFMFNTRGGTLFGQATAENVGERFAIILDDVVQSAPRIQTAITGGSGRITGNFTIEQAQDLATIIQAGALPAKVTVIEERTVGPGLGADSIRAGTTASLIGLVLVAIFMLIAYGMFGVFAVTSLSINILLIIGCLSGLGATLTLPGIAGIILTIGMAVDANVLVFERIREENRAGRSPMSAVDTGYQQALSTILDANITTLLAAVILYLLGSGPVKGFAVTLAIGIFTSVFTAFVVTRLITYWWLRAARPKKLPL